MVGEGLWKNSVHDILHGQPLRVHPESEYQYLGTDAVARIVLTLVRRKTENDVFNVCGDGRIAVSAIADLAGKNGLACALPDARRERDEVNIEKLKCLVSVPKTVDTIRKFITRCE